jgi:TolA-binding protein
MAKQPQRDDDQSKKPHGEQPPAPKTPKPAIPNMSLDEPADAAPLEVEEVFEEDVPVVEAAPASDVAAAEPADEVFAEEVIEEATASEVVEEAPVEAVPLTPQEAAAEEVFAAEAAEVVGSSAVVAEPEDVGEAAHAEAEPVIAAHASDVDLMRMFEEEAAKAKGAEPALAPAEAAPSPILAAAAPPAAAHSFPETAAAASAPIKAPKEYPAPTPSLPLEDVVAREIAQAAPASKVKPDDVVFGDAAGVSAPASGVGAAEEIVEEAAPASGAKGEDVLFDEEITEAAPASEAKSAEVVEELAEAVEEVSSATRKAEAVLDDEVAAEIASAAEVIEEATAEEAVLDADEAEAVEAGSSSVLSDEAVDEGAAVKKSASAAGKKTDFDIGLAPSSTAAKKTPDDLAVTEVEVEGASEASAVDLGDMPARKGSSATGIDEVAEVLESGVDLEAEETEPLAPKAPSVEFDELLDDEGEEAPAKKGKPAAKVDDDSTEVDSLIEEAVGADDEEIVAGKKEAKKPKKGKPAAKATGDDIDVDEYFGEAEKGKAVGPAAEAEAAEAFDEEMEAAEAFDVGEAEEAKAAEDEDEKPKKKTKAAIEEEEAEVDEEVSAKKKRKDNKDRAMPAPAAAQTSTFLRVFVGMFLATIILAGAAAGAWYFAPDQLKDLAKMSPNVTPDKKLQSHVPKKLEIAHEAMDQGNFQEAIELLKDAAEPAELGTRGEARWFAYFKDLDKNALPDAEHPKVKEAIADLENGQNKLFLAQVKNTLAQKSLQKKLQENLDKAIVEKGELAKKFEETAGQKAIAQNRIESAKQVLVAGNFIRKNEEFDVAVLQRILKELSDDKAALAGVNQILIGAKIKGTGAEGIKEVLKLKKEADDSFTAVNKVLANEKTKGKGDKGVLEIVDARNQMTKDRNDLQTTLEAAFKELVDAKIVKDGADPRREIVAGMKLARQKAESPLSIPLAQLSMSLGGIASGTSKVVEQSFSMAKVFSELGYFRTREPFIQTPEQKMNNYLALLQDRQRNNPKELGDIIREADWVLAPEAKADVESRAKARYVQGLALRNQEKFTEAKSAFDETLKLIAKIDKTGVWSELARRSHKELVDPNAFYLPRIDRFRADGNPRAALDEANTALKAMPEEARLFAQRGLIRFELVRGQGLKVPEAAQKTIRADAQRAGKDEKLAAESAYIVGLLEEELGNWAEAEKLYRQAIKMYPAMDETAGKYRVALARLLLRDREENPAAPAGDEKKKKDDKVGATPAAQERIFVLHPWTLLVVSAVIAQGQPPDETDDKETLSRLNETLKLAEELIASKNDKIKGQGYFVKGSALSKLGKRTEGLKEYSKGLKLIYPGIATKEMTDLIQDHPAFQQPDVAGTPNPLMAERHFGEGIHFYWSKQYPQAEAQFRQAVKYYDKDARFQYYLGLSQLQQKTKLKRDAAIYSFEQGARLEAKLASTNPDAVREVNASLERIQGELRQYLNSYRYKAMSAEPDAR